MEKYPTIWKTALALWRIKKRYPTEKIIEIDGEYFCKGVLLQEKENGSFYYEKVLYKVKL